MSTTRLLIFVVSYNAEDFIEGVLKRIPEHVKKSTEYETEILIIDDQSHDKTFHRSVFFSERNPEIKITVLYNPRNLGYGGNQKLGYHYAILNAFDIVLLLHGDGQYPPEFIDSMVRPILSCEADAVFGSRMLRSLDALRGGMPFYKWLGNRILTTIQNHLLSSRLSEFHSGYRAYSVRALAVIPFSLNSDDFDFDTDIIIQLLDTGHRIVEIPIPTHYGDEISHVNGIKYAVQVVSATLMSRVVRLGIAHVPKFSYRCGNEVYESKLGYSSSHSFALHHVPQGGLVIDFGCGPGFMARELSSRGSDVISIDREILPETRMHSIETVETDIDDFDFSLKTQAPISAGARYYRAPALT